MRHSVTRLTDAAACASMFLVTGRGWAVAALAASKSGSAQVEAKRIIEADREPGAWMTTGRTYDLYNDHCGMCHGPSTVGRSVLPDLRYLTPEKHRIVAGILAGAFAPKGMPSFMDILSVPDVDAIHQYIIKRAHDLKKEREEASR